MPRKTTGQYVLPLPPVVADTDILAAWANTTTDDLGNALTDSLPRAGGVPMAGPLYLARNAVDPNEAVTKIQLDAAIGSESSFLPAGTIMAFAKEYSNSGTPAPPPIGWLVCDGSSQAASSYPDLVKAIGTTYGTGNQPGSTFNLPDLRGLFVRGYSAGQSTDPGRAFGSTQADANLSHTHAVNEGAGHAHPFTVDPFTPVINDTHRHGYTTSSFNDGSGSGSGTFGGTATPATTGFTSSGSITANQVALPQKDTDLATTGLSISNDGSTESRPKNVAMTYCIRYVGDYTGGQIGTIASQNYNDVNITGGAAWLGYGRVAAAPVNPTDIVRLEDLKIQVSDVNFIGAYDIPYYSNKTPSEAFPSIQFIDGQMVEVSVGGNLTVYNGRGELGIVNCVVGSQLIYTSAQPLIPSAGWVYNPPPTLTGVTAASITYVPATAGSWPAGTDTVQEGLDYIGDFTPRISGYTNANRSQYSLVLPAGDTVHRDGGTPYGYIRWNTQLLQYEGYGINGWSQIGLTNTANLWALPQRSVASADTDTNFNLALGNNFESVVAAGGAKLLEFTGIANAAGQSGLILLTVPVGTSITQGANVKATAAMWATISEAGTHLLSYYCNGTNVYVTGSGVMV